MHTHAKRLTEAETEIGDAFGNSWRGATLRAPSVDMVRRKSYQASFHEARPESKAAERLERRPEGDVPTGVLGLMRFRIIGERSRKPFSRSGRQR